MKTDDINNRLLFYQFSMINEILDQRNKSEEELWAGLHYKSCKYCVNEPKKLGLEVR